MTTFADQGLEEQIAQWREYLRRRQAFHGSDIEELEGHLRDQLTALTEAGLAEEEAFLVAVKRMGSLDALSREFARAHSERLWKQLVIAPDDADRSANTTHAETVVVLILAVADCSVASAGMTSCFHSRSKCARANSRDSASRLPMRLTATRNASSAARPPSVSATS